MFIKYNKKESGRHKTGTWRDEIQNTWSEKIRKFKNTVKTKVEERNFKRTAKMNRA